MGWLNALAEASMIPMLVTAAVFQLPIGWLNALQVEHIVDADQSGGVAAVLQLPMGWLNARA
jgi:hypothetical protein